MAKKAINKIGYFNKNSLKYKEINRIKIQTSEKKTRQIL